MTEIVAQRAARDRHHRRDQRRVTEQSQGIGQVNAAVSQIDQMTQQNAALVRSVRRRESGCRVN
jgi:methyl-accepting chemotaxis protein